MKAALVGQPKAFDGGEAEVRGEVAQLGLEAGERLEGADDMALEDMPKGDAEFAGHGHGGPPEAGCDRGGRLRPAPTFSLPAGGAALFPSVGHFSWLVRVWRPLGCRLASRFSLCDIQ